MFWSQVWADIWESLQLEIPQLNLQKTDPKMTNRLKLQRTVCSHCLIVVSHIQTSSLEWYDTHRVCLECRFIYFTYFHKVSSTDCLCYGAFLPLPKIKETCVRRKYDRGVNREECWSSTWAKYSGVRLQIFLSSQWVAWRPTVHVHNSGLLIKCWVTNKSRNSNSSCVMQDNGLILCFHVRELDEKLDTTLVAVW